LYEYTLVDGRGTWKNNHQSHVTCSHLHMALQLYTDVPPMQFPVPRVTPSVDRNVSVHLSDKVSTAPSTVFEVSTRSPPRSNSKTFKPPSAIV
jgi:hypothetical protein